MLLNNRFPRQDPRADGTADPVRCHQIGPRQRCATIDGGSSGTLWA